MLTILVKNIVNTINNTLKAKSIANTNTKLLLKSIANTNTNNSVTILFLLFSHSAMFIFFHSHLLIKLTRCSAITERPRCRVRYSFPQK